MFELSKVEEFKVSVAVSDAVTYFILPDDSVVSEDDWTETSSTSGDYWSYEFKSDELALLDYYLSDASDGEVSRLCHVLVLDFNIQDFHHALYSVLKEFR